MNDLIKNNPKHTCHQVLIEKLNNFSKEMSLFDILVYEYGLKPRTVNLKLTVIGKIWLN